MINSRSNVRLKQADIGNYELQYSNHYYVIVIVGISGVYEVWVDIIEKILSYASVANAKSIKPTKKGRVAHLEVELNPKNLIWSGSKHWFYEMWCLRSLSRYHWKNNAFWGPVTLKWGQSEKFEIMTHLLHMDPHHTKIEINLTSSNEKSGVTLICLRTDGRTNTREAQY